MKYPRKRHRKKPEARRAVEGSKATTAIVKKPLPHFINPEGFYR